MVDCRCIAIVPIRGSDDEFVDGPRVMLGDRPLIAYTIEAALAAERLDRVFVSTDSPEISAFAEELGVETLELRPPHLSQPGVPGTEVFRHAIERLSATGCRAEWLVKLEVTHPFRPPGIINQVIELALSQDIDSAFLAYEEPHSYWLLGVDGQPVQVGDEMDVPRGIRRPLYRDVGGVVSITRWDNILAGRMYGERLALIPVDDVFVTVDIHEGKARHYRDKAGFRLAEALLPEYHRAIGCPDSRK